MFQAVAPRHHDPNSDLEVGSDHRTPRWGARRAILIPTSAGAALGPGQYRLTMSLTRRRWKDATGPDGVLKESGDLTFELSEDPQSA